MAPAPSCAMRRLAGTEVALDGGVGVAEAVRVSRVLGEGDADVSAQQGHELVGAFGEKAFEALWEMLLQHGVDEH